jgi:hypothetical protein
VIIPAMTLGNVNAKWRVTMASFDPDGNWFQTIAYGDKRIAQGCYKHSLANMRSKRRTGEALPYVILVHHLVNEDWQMVRAVGNGASPEDYLDAVEAQAAGGGR